MAQSVNKVQAIDLAASGIRADQQDARLLATTPASADLRVEADISATGRGDRIAALSRMQRAVQEEPRNAQRRMDLALMALELGAYYEAIAHFEAVLACWGELPEALLGLGRALVEAKQWELAADRLERAVHVAPESANAWSELGHVYIELGRFEAALHALEAAAKQAPQDIRISVRLARALLLAGRPQQAELLIATVLAQCESCAEAWLVLGDIHLILDDPQQALASHRRAVELEPAVASYRRAMADTELAVGDFAGGWRRLAQSWQRDAVGSGLELWDGSAGSSITLVIEEEQVVADTLLLCRYLDRATACFSRVMFRCSNERKSLLSRSFPNVSFLSETPDLDVTKSMTVSLASLPGLLGVEAPAEVQVPYLRADDTHEGALRARRADNRLHVGLCWQGFDRPAERCHVMHLSRLLPILSMEQIRCVSLQTGAAAEQIHALPAQYGLQSMETFAGAPCGDMDQLAHVIGELDLVIAVDGEVAHLSGALGRPTWVMLANTPRPFWGLTARTWYPNVRLFSQKRRNDYSDVVSMIHTALLERVLQHELNAQGA